MKIDKTGRDTLKSYFVKNAVPTQGNFEDLINAGLNQREDGIAKNPGEPLSIQADGDDASQKKVFNLYRSFTDAAPAWSLALNPRANPADPATARAGFGVTDSNSNCRLYIDQATGRLGVGTVTPTAALDVAGVVRFATDFNTQKDPDSRLTYGGAVVIKGNAPQIDFLDRDHADWAIHVNSNKMYFIREPWIHNDLVLDGAGNVGFGTDSPRAKLEVNGGAIMLSAGEKADSGITFPSDPGGGSGDTAWLRYFARKGESCTLELGIANDGDDHIALMPSGSVGVGTREPKGKLDVAGSIVAGNSDLYFSRTDHDHTGIGNQAGWAAIENAANHKCLMILGRNIGTAQAVNRVVGVWDSLHIQGRAVLASDRNAKLDIEPLQRGLADVLRLEPVSFNWKRLANPKKSIGLIAQDVQAVIDEVVFDTAMSDDSRLGIAYDSLIPVLIKAIQELTARLQTLEQASPAAA